MTIESAQVQVSTIPVSLATGGTNGVRVSIYNAGSQSVYLGGGTTVSGTTGHVVASSATPLSLYVDQSETLYAIAGSGTATVHVLKGGVDAA